jgi:hypothetical protein
MFKVNQPVWCVMFGAGVVRNNIATDTRFPLVVEFNGKLEYYTLDGKYVLNTAQVLFPHPVEIVKKVTKPSINWKHVAPKFKYLAEDSGGSAFLFEEKPFIASAASAWCVQSVEVVDAIGFASYAPGTCDWKSSLISRPDSD